ncbi:TAXI family TRAP transporter solute-binding subunit [Hyphomonas sp. WL0036]|uniref:TAXI family TRAP transporter solute-binding subunit n=1 Tax=Hyphomonas sediminis TaxID=2866160 RepID=UPI001C802BFA|nr:TAXI family TRAP transporter solute-binding subunit [Hyphomonas sediminis]MBY9065715.1 TAXI family TRAP transporter solute-binding subunit [Hyphomonas sediminis]
MPGRDFWKIYGPLIVVALIGFVWALSAMDPAPPGKIKFAAGAPGGAYHAYAERYQRLLEDQGIEVELVDTAGSIDNLRLLEEGVADVAIVQGGLARSEDAEILRSAGGIFEEPFWIFVRADYPAQSFSDLRGARLSIGAEGSGTRALALSIQQQYGGAWPEAARQKLGSTDSQAALFAGEIDAAAFAAAADAPYIQALMRSNEVRLLSFERAEALARREEALSSVTLIRGVIDVGADIPAEDVPLVAAIAQLTVRKDVHPAIEALLLDSAVLVHSEPSVFTEGGEFPNMVNVDLPVSKQVARYYQDGPSFLRRYFPFSVANFLDRAWVLAIPLLTLAIPLVRAAPPIYRWRVRRKIYVWYEDLRELEEKGRALAPGEARSGVLRSLEKLQVEVGKLEVPLSYNEDLYQLRSHIEFVKRLLSSTEPVTDIAL